MPERTEITTYDDVMHSFSWDSLWALFDGDRDCMHLTHECIDRHRDQGIAVSVRGRHRKLHDPGHIGWTSSRSVLRL
jgi:hypothetical protein